MVRDRPKTGRVCTKRTSVSIVEPLSELARGALSGDSLDERTSESSETEQRHGETSAVLRRRSSRERPGATSGCTSRGWAPTRSAPVPIIVSGEGCYVYDADGKRYLDGLSALYCVNVGHGRPELGEAAAAQLRELDFFTNWSYAHPRAIELASAIAALAPGDLNRVFFTSGGSEAVESAMKLARAYHRGARQDRAAQGDRARDRLPRHDARRALGDRPDGAARAVRAADAGRLPRPEHQLLPLAGGARPAVGGRRDRGGDRVRGRRARSPR